MTANVARATVVSPQSVSAAMPQEVVVTSVAVVSQAISVLAGTYVASSIARIPAAKATARVANCRWRDDPVDVDLAFTDFPFQPIIEVGDTYSTVYGAVVVATSLSVVAVALQVGLLKAPAAKTPADGVCSASTALFGAYFSPNVVGVATLLLLSPVAEVATGGHTVLGAVLLLSILVAVFYGAVCAFSPRACPPAVEPWDGKFTNDGIDSLTFRARFGRLFGLYVCDSRLWPSASPGDNTSCAVTAMQLSTRMAFAVDVAGAVILSAVASLPVAMCVHSAIVIVAMSGAILLYLVVLRPYRERLTMIAGLINALLQVAAAGYAAGAVIERDASYVEIVSYIQLVQFAMFTLFAGLSAALSVVESVRRGKQEGALTTPDSSEATAPLLVLHDMKSNEAQPSNSSTHHPAMVRRNPLGQCRQQQ
jgi:hypothetical protein